MLKLSLIITGYQNTGIISKKKSFNQFINKWRQIINVNNKQKWSQNRSLRNSCLTLSQEEKLS
jgi:hypothetical protein